MVGINPVRGDVAVMIDGVERRLRLTFGALAEIEASLGTQGLAGLGARLGRLSAAEMQLVLAALLRGGGEMAAARALAGARVELGAAARAIAAAFREAMA
jgi:hypothetical protein